MIITFEKYELNSRITYRPFFCKTNAKSDHPVVSFLEK